MPAHGSEGLQPTLRSTTAIPVERIGVGRLPALLAPDPNAERRVIEFFTAHIRNPNTRRAYAQAAAGRYADLDTRRQGGQRRGSEANSGVRAPEIGGLDGSWIPGGRRRWPGGSPDHYVRFHRSIKSGTLGLHRNPKESGHSPIISTNPSSRTLPDRFRSSSP